MAIKKSISQDTLFCNSGRFISASGFTPAVDGTFTLPQNKTSSTLIIPITGMREDEIIKKFKILGALGATSGSATVLDAELKKVTKGAGAVTDTSIGAITQVSVEEDTALESSKLVDERISKDYQYFVLVTGTTADNAACDIAITGVEISLE
jgi:hypothetical protein